MIRLFLLASSLACISACAAVSPEADLPAAELYGAELRSAEFSPSATCSPSEPTETESSSNLSAAAESRSAESARGPSEPAFTLLDGELQTQGGWAVPTSQASKRTKRPEWRPGQALLQGFFGADFMDQINVDTGSNTTVENKGTTIMPVIGGGGQWKLSGDKVDFGLEGMLSIAWQANATAIAAGGGGVAVAVDFGLLLVDLYGGPFVSMFLGDSTRVYVAAGPLLEWANYDQSTGLGNIYANGFGAGGYARTGIEFLLPSNTMIGLAARWSKSQISLNNNLGNMDLEGLQCVLTVTRGF